MHCFWIASGSKLCCMHCNSGGLHWLPVDKRIEYKLLLYTYKALHDLAPGIFVNWLCRMCHVEF